MPTSYFEITQMPCKWTIALNTHLAGFLAGFLFINYNGSRTNDIRGTAMSDLSYVDALNKVKELTVKYAKDPLGEGFEALHELKQLSSDTNIKTAINKLSDNSNLAGKDLDVVKDFQKQVLSPQPIPTPPNKAIEPNKPQRENFPPPFGSSKPSNNAPSPQENYGKKLVDFRNTYKADPKVQRLFNAKLTSCANNNSVNEANLYAIQQWLAGSGPPNYFGATKLGPVWNNIGAATLGDIAGDINANLADDNLENAQFGDALGKVNSHMNDLADAAKPVEQHMDLKTEATPPILHGGVLDKAISAIDHALDKALVTAPTPNPQE